MRNRGLLFLTFLLSCFCVVPLVLGEEVRIPPTQGFVSDFANVLPPQTRQQLTNILQELQEKTTAEIAVVTVDSTQPLSPFDYAMRIAETWKPGAKGKDNGVVFLVAAKDRKMFIVTGYGVEGILPDGKIGAIQDEYIVPAFKQGDYAKGILNGTKVMASLIAQNMESPTGVPTMQRARRDREVPFVPAVALVFVVIGLVLAFYRTRRSRYSRFRGGGPYDSGFGGGGFGGGGFGGGGSGEFGGLAAAALSGGAGRDW
jgi:uncharacterized protein